MNTLTTRRKFGLLAAATTLIASTSCSASGNSETGPEAGDLTFVYKGDNDQQKAFTSMFEVFNEKYPEINLKAQGIPTEDWATFANTVATRLAGGETIDIIQVATEGQRLFASKDILEPLEQFIDADKDYVEEYWADISPRLKEFNDTFASGPNGETLFIPGGFNTMGMYLNKRVFSQADVEIPEDGNWTWDEFLEAGKRIKEATEAFLVPAGVGYFDAVMPWLTTNGTSTFTDDWQTPTIDSPAAIEAAEFARQLVEEGLAPAPGGEFDANTAFAQDKLAVIPGGRWPTLSLRDLEMIDQTVVVNWPQNSTNGTPAGWDAWNISKKSNNKEAAWTFIKFLMSEEASQHFASVGGTIVPARQSVAQSDYFTDDAPEFSTRLSDAMDFATAIPSIDRGAEAESKIREAWTTIISGHGDAQEVLTATQKELERLVNEE